MRATKGRKPTPPPNLVTHLEMRREAIGKPWKNKRAQKTFVFQEILIDAKHRPTCLRKLKAAVKKAKK